MNTQKKETLINSNNEWKKQQLPIHINTSMCSVINTRIKD